MRGFYAYEMSPTQLRHDREGGAHGDGDSMKTLVEHLHIKEIILNKRAVKRSLFPSELTAISFCCLPRIPTPENIPHLPHLPAFTCPNLFGQSSARFSRSIICYYDSFSISMAQWWQGRANPE